jgi:hypothetical protein
VTIGFKLATEKPQVSGLISLLEELPCHDHALDLVGALVDLGDLRTWMACALVRPPVVHACTVALVSASLGRTGGHRPRVAGPRRRLLRPPDDRETRDFTF